MARKPDPRPEIDLSPKFVAILEEAVSNHQGIKAALIGVYEGRQLNGDYKLQILGARLIPVKQTEV